MSGCGQSEPSTVSSLRAPETGDELVVVESAQSSVSSALELGIGGEREEVESERHRAFSELESGDEQVVAAIEQSHVFSQVELANDGEWAVVETDGQCFSVVRSNRHRARQSSHA